jgi:Fe-S cluster biosynthesis and repair protein YggX
MAVKTVKCVKLGKELPGIDATTPKGDQTLRMCRLFGGTALVHRVLENVSAQAWELWTGHMRMVMNEYRLDPTSDESNQILRHHMEAFFFGQEQQVPNFVPPEAPAG